MSKKYFPIRTKTSCQLKWTWSTIRLYNGTTSSCHRVGSDLITAETFDSFHNTAKKLQDRKLMLDGQWPSGGCEYCKNIEEHGGHSDRMTHFEIPDLVPPELESDQSAIEITPRILEVYFDNVCNMSCLYCWNGFSSKIEQENIKHGPFEKNGVKIVNTGSRSQHFNELNEAFWQWMHQHSKNLSRIHVLGGEPFYQAQFENCLEFFENNPHPNIEFNVVSNLMIDHVKFQMFISRIKKLVARRHLKRFDLTCSIDCWGPEQEYVRYGLNLEQWKKNFEFVVKEKWIYLSINQTISALTIKSMPDMLKYIYSFSNQRKINQYFGTTVGTHDFLHPKIFGSDFFDKDFENIYNEMLVDTSQQQQAVKYMQGIHKELQSHSRNQEKIDQLATFLDEMDRRRKLNWRETFPWLEKETSHVV